ncbi:hypothetical protein Q1695_001028 [Nippostrongylus brasiliensis]|nr:hypothetical protein Q1695_001028 [Nippostrongylus brasiliensis]
MPGGSGLSSIWDRKDATRKMSSDVQDITQNEYLNRLLAAHNRVDDLLRSRGLSAEDESKYLRAWEEIPVVRKERFQRVRTPSDSSDSGLSTDNDSDRSNSEAVKKEGATCEQQFSRPNVRKACLKVVPSPLSKIQSSLTCVAVEAEYRSAAFSLFGKPSSKKVSKVMSVPSKTSEHAELKCSSPVSAVRSVTCILKKKAKKEVVSKVLAAVQKIEKVAATFAAPNTPPKPESVRQQKKPRSESVKAKRKLENAKTVPIVEQQRTVLARLKPKPTAPIPSTAEISIQHCSFYQVSKRAVEAPEKNVRMNLRLTERAPSKCSATIALPTSSRPLFAYMNVMMDRPPLKRTSTDVPKRPVGKLNRSMTIDSPQEAKQLRKVNRLIIPEYFLQSHCEADESLKNARDQLKKVEPQVIGGFVVEAKKPCCLKRTNAIRKKPTMEKSVTDAPAGGCVAPYLDFLPPVIGVGDNKPLKTELQSLSSQASLANTIQNPLNSTGSLDRAATTSGAPSCCKKVEIAEMSHVDRVLVEQFRRSKHIPRPKALAQRALLTVQAFQVRNRLQTSTPKVEFIRYTTPQRRPPQPQHVSSAPSLRKVYRSSKHFSKRVQLLECPPLKKVDRAKRKKLKIRRRKRWIPRWRRKCIEEEVTEEVEEEEEEEEEEETVSRSLSVGKNDSNRNRAPSDDDEHLTEAEKAMAASKRRQVEDQQNKLQEYDERRRIEREKEEEELKRLKEKLERRRLEREQEEREQAERRKQEEDRRRKEEEERKAKQEEEKRKKEEEKMRRQQMSGAAFSSTTGQGGRNFVIPKKSENRNDKFGNIVQAKQEMGMTKEQQEEAKRAFLASVAKCIPLSRDLQPNDLKARIKELHQRICKLEAEKYDLEKRHERQEYDLKELNERQRQVARNNALKKGIDPTDAASSKYPPKVQIFSKYDRQIDRRNFTERRRVYDNKNAYPCFPGVPPPPAIFEKVIMKLDAERDDDDDE